MRSGRRGDRVPVNRDQAAHDVEDEVSFHLEQRAKKLIEEGWKETEAWSEARRRFGDEEEVRVAMSREMRARARRARWDELRQDVTYAVRALRKSRGFTAVVVITLALGIGANTAVFSVVDGVLLRPLPYDDADRLVYVDQIGMGVRGELLELQDRVRSFEQAAWYSANGHLSLTGEGDPVRLASASVSAELFPLLGVEPMLGRGFLTAESVPGADGVAILGHALWQQSFGGDPGVLDTTIRLDDRERTVVGVMPPGFGFPGAATQVWVPAVIPSSPSDLWGWGGWQMIARLAEGVSVATASAEVLALGPEMRRLVPWQMQPGYWTLPNALVPLQTQMAGRFGTVLLLLFGAVGLVLLMACVNIANLLLARGAARAPELALRTALGAGRRRILSQLLTESALLVVLGGGLGLLVATWGVSGMERALASGPPLLERASIDGRALVFTAMLSIAAALVFGLLPAFRITGGNLAVALHDGRRTGPGAEASRTGGALVTAQVALAVVLVTGAGLMTRSLTNLLAVDPGFRTEGVSSAVVSLPAFRYGDLPSRRAVFDEIERRLERMPSVEAAALASVLPLGPERMGGVFLIEGRTDPSVSGDWPIADAWATVSPGYFDVLGVPVLEGRGFERSDREGAEPVVVVSHSLAEQYWPGESAVGKRLQLLGRPWVSVVGVVADVEWRALTGGRRSALYLPVAQADPVSMRVVVRSAAYDADVVAAIREVVAAVDDATPVSDFRTMEELVSTSIAAPRSATLFLGLFALAALALATVGVYGLASYTTRRRTREFGIRMALGAHAGDVLALVLRRGMLVAAMGVGIGLFGAALGTRLLRDLLYGVSPHDPVTLVAVPLVLGAATLLALYLPARQAARVDPTVAFRHE